MHINCWQQSSAKISARNRRAFFDHPIDQTHLFLFKTSSLHVPPHSGAFSLKLTFAGEERYALDDRRVAIRPGDLLFVNAGQPYASDIDSATRSMSIFLPPGEAAKIAALFQNDPERHLDPSAGGALEVPAVRFRASEPTRALCVRLARSALRGEHDLVEEMISTLLLRAWDDLFGAVPQAALSDVRKSATRDELIRRVARAREYIEDRMGQGCSLDRLAGLACLSKYHFLRTFRDVFGETPARYARRLRLEDALAAGAEGEAQDRIARRVGYANRYALRRALRHGARSGPQN